MLFFVDGPCEAECEENLYRLRQIRDKLSKNYPGQLYASKNNLGENYLHLFQDLKLNDQGAIFLIDPRGFLMMRYPGDTDPSGIIRDLSRLLRISG